MLLAIGIERPLSIPDGLQIDWEAILSPTVAAFRNNIATWCVGDCTVRPEVAALPSVQLTLPTLRHVFNALNVELENGEKGK